MPRRHSARGKSRGKDLCLLEDLEGRSLLRLREQTRKARKVVRSEHDVHVRRPRLDGLLVLLCKTASDDNLHVGPRVLDGLHVPEVSVQSLVRVLTDAARVEQNDRSI